jgi:LysM repeat protein
MPFSYLLECPGMRPDVRYNISHHVEQLSVNLAGSEAIEVKAVLAFDTFMRSPVHMQVITDAELVPISIEEVEKRPGIVGYIVKDGDELWSLAKKYMTTVEGIKEVNNLESDSIKPGDKLLIFKEGMSII